MLGNTWAYTVSLVGPAQFGNVLIDEMGLLDVSWEYEVQLTTDFSESLENGRFKLQRRSFGTVSERRGSRGTPLPDSLTKILELDLQRELIAHTPKEWLDSFSTVQSMPIGESYPFPSNLLMMP
ncbi:hypothetical protein Salat_2797200 [Sesamum alatum]|uniref:Uncharacterized protein n=1 Tax=Sesamum alatum TaxID=300844 RepID=A0AAE1XLB9_9LAMI|nr:hypothetical protein Salat_2797200 [Sesamum alatum]